MLGTNDIIHVHVQMKHRPCWTRQAVDCPSKNLMHNVHCSTHSVTWLWRLSILYSQFQLHSNIAYAVDFTESSRELLRTHGIWTRRSCLQKWMCVNNFRETVAPPHYFPWSLRHTQCSNAAEIDCINLTCNRVGKSHTYTCITVYSSTVVEYKRYLESHPHALHCISTPIWTITMKLKHTMV